MQSEERRKQSLTAKPASASGQQEEDNVQMNYTKLEMALIDKFIEYQQSGMIKYKIIPQMKIEIGGTIHPVDFAFPQIKLIVEADGEVFHTAPKQMAKDINRDKQLNQMGWTVLRFKDSEIEQQMEQVMGRIMGSIKNKEESVKNIASQA